VIEKNDRDFESAAGELHWKHRRTRRRAVHSTKPERGGGLRANAEYVIANGLPSQGKGVKTCKEIVTGGEEL